MGEASREEGGDCDVRTVVATSEESRRGVRNTSSLRSSLALTFLRYGPVLRELRDKKLLLNHHLLPLLILELFDLLLELLAKFRA